ncbi:MAG TPA: hypothetical protein VGR56_07410 [Nitrososphaerales archaeon]|nr:hypothetical protein [Nitrososphaerales archaeon]
MVSAKAYALLENLLPYMAGLKLLEARAALSFFPRSGIVSGRHTTDEFMGQIWREFAISSLEKWNARRRKKLTDSELANMAKTWLEGRIRRARRAIDEPQ